MNHLGFEPERVWLEL